MDPYPKRLDWLRFLSALLLFTYGSSKLLGRQFTLPPEVALRPVGSLNGYQLAWFYYSYSHVYAVILGLIQIAGGVLLLFRKTALLGAAITLPVMTNIVMINVFFSIAWGALGTSTFIFFHVGRALAPPPGAHGRVLDPAGRRTGQFAALLPYHRGADCLAGNHPDGIGFMARRRLKDFKVIQRGAASISN